MQREEMFLIYYSRKIVKKIICVDLCDYVKLRRHIQE